MCITNNRVFIFGLDAASPTLIARWLNDLPTLKKLISAGTWGTLQSTMPPFTSPAWACMATGKNPAKVGIFGLRQRQPGSYRFVPTAATERRTPALWEMAGQHGRFVICHNVPDTFPPTAVHGLMISGHPAPNQPGAPITYPAGLRAELDALTGGYPIGPNAEFDDHSRQEELPTWRMVLQQQQQALLHLIKTEPWQLCFTASLAIDGICHHFWQYLDPNHPDYNRAAAAPFADTIRQIYQLEDQRLAQIMAQLTPDDLLLVVSDHGSTPCYRHIAVNRWLIEQGYLVLQSETAVSTPPSLLRQLASPLFSLYRRSALVRRLAAPLRQTALRDQLVQAHFMARSHGRTPFTALPIDWQKTTAYYLGDNRLYLNVAGREPSGTVQPGTDYTQKRDRLRQQLLAATDPESKRPLFAAVHLREDIYSGPYLAKAPDLILVPGDSHWNLGGAVGSRVVDRPVMSGMHHPEGVFIAWGAGVRAAQKRKASIYDIAPTVLHALGLPIPADSDGTVQQSWFAAHSEIARRPVETAVYDDLARTDFTWSTAEQTQIEARLRNLGYLD